MPNAAPYYRGFVPTFSLFLVKSVAAGVVGVVAVVTFITIKKQIGNGVSYILHYIDCRQFGIRALFLVP